MDELVNKILRYLTTEVSGRVNSLELATELEESHERIIGAVKCVQCLGDDLVAVEQKMKTKTELTEEGKFVVKKGSQEAIVFRMVHGGPQGVPLDTLISKVTTVFEGSGAEMVSSIKKVGLSKAIKNGWVKMIRNEEGQKIAYRCVDTINDKVQSELKIVKADIKENPYHPFEDIGDLKIRKLVTQTKVIYLVLRCGQNFTDKVTNLKNEVATGVLSTPKLNYNGTIIVPGYLHPILTLRSEMRRVLLQMGFSEISESSWNFQIIPTSSQFLSRILPTSPDNPFKPLSLFSITRVYQTEKNRNTICLSESYQLECFTCAHNLNLGNLIGLLKTFCGKLDIHKLRFTPAYTPFTEPSMKILAYHSSLQKWVELGISGMLRPEVLHLHPFKLPADVRILTWTLPVEKLAMIRYDMDNIHELVGDNTDFQKIYRITTGLDKLNIF